MSRFGIPSGKGYDGIHMRGRMAVQHYTGSLVNVLLQNLPKFEKASKTPINLTPLYPPTYANIVKKKMHPNQSKPNHMQPNKGYYAQPQFVPGNAQNTGPARQQYNVDTQNGFSAFQSGN